MQTSMLSRVCAPCKSTPPSAARYALNQLFIEIKKDRLNYALDRYPHSSM